MKDINFIKNIDNLGRIVIPMDIRRKLNINTGDVLSITCGEKDICLCKYSTLNDSRVKDIINLFIDTFKIKVILVDKESVVYSNIVLAGTKLDGNEQLLVCDGKSFSNSYQAFVFGSDKVEDYYSQVPVVTNDGIIGSLIILGSQLGNEYLLCKLIANIIALELNIS